MPESVVLFIGDLSIGGAERVVVNLAQGLSERQINVEIVLVNKQGALLQEVPASVSVHELGVNRLRWSPIPLARYLRDADPEVVISFMTGVNVMTILANKIAGSPAKTIVTEHNTQTMKQSASAKRDMMLAKLVYRYADRIVGVSAGVSEDVCDWVNVPDERICTIYNPVLDDNFVGTQWEVPSCSWYESKGKSVIVSAGRHTKQKDHHTLLRAFAKLSARRDARLVLLGGGELTDEYRQLAMDLGISEYVHMPGFVDNPHSYMYHSDLFALSSAWEGLSLVLIEAMGCGTPVVSTDCPNGPAEVLRNGEYGPLVPVGDAEALAHEMDQLLENPTPAEKLRERALEFSIETATEKYVQLF